MMYLSTLVIATTNPGKLREVALILEHLPLTLRSLTEFEGVVTVKETGQTYAENAQLKAQACFFYTGLPNCFYQLIFVPFSFTVTGDLLLKCE